MPKLKKKSSAQKRKTDVLRKRKSPQASTSLGQCGSTVLDEDDETSNGGVPDNINIDIGVHEYSFIDIMPQDVLHGELNIQFMDYISQILKVQFHCGYGLLPPTYVYTMASGKEELQCLKIPLNTDAVQFHFITGHYVLSARKQQQMYVYDSLPHPHHIESVIPQLRLLYEQFNAHDIQCVTPQHQESTILCGLFVIANAFSLLTNVDPSTLHFHTAEMRPHLHNCLQEGVLSEFPHTIKTVTRQTNILLNTQLLQSYFKDQSKKSSAKQRKCTAEELQLEKNCSKTLQYKQKQNERQNITRKVKRNDQIYKMNENIKRKNSRTVLRSDPDYRKEESLKRTETRTSLRSDPVYKKNESLKRKKTRICLRSDPDYTKNESLKRKKTRICLRSDPDYTKNESLKRKKTRICLRSDLDYTKNESLKQNKTRTCLRSDPDYTKNESLKRKKTRTCLRSDPGYTKNESLKRKKTRTCLRSDPDYTKKERLKRKKTRTCLRSDPDYTKNESLKRKKTRTCLRSDPDYTNDEGLKRKKKRDRLRSDPDYKKSENLKRKKTRISLRSRHTYAHKENETKRLRIQHSHKVSINELIQKFHKIVSCGPCFVCCLCRQLWYEHSVVKRNSGFSGLSLETVLRDIYQKYNCKQCPAISTDSFVCRTCVSHLKKKKIPPCSTLNKMTFPEQGPLKDLNVLEQLLLAPVLPFLRLQQANVGKQYLVQGNVVLVPSDVKNTVSALPRLSTNTAIIKARLKRRLRYKNHLYNMNIRPEILRDGISFLSKTSKLYKDHNIFMDENFSEQEVLSEKNSDDTEQISKMGISTKEIEIENSDSVHHPYRTSSNLPNQSGSDSDEAWSECDSSELLQSDNPGIQDTMLTSSDFVEPSEKDFVYNFAPAEGKKPISVFLEPNAEELSFPSIFCGQSRATNKERLLPVTYSEIVRSELRNADRRAALSIENIFFKTKKLQMKQLIDQTQIAIRKSKTKGQVLTAKDVRGDSSKHFIYQDKAFKFMSSIRGSPSYFQTVSKNLFAMIRQLGPGTFFCSLSAAETRWTHLLCILSQVVDKKTCTEEEASNFNWQTKCRLIQSDPITCARHFDFAVNKFFKNFLLTGSNPISPIEDYFYRVEYQQRGSPHVHILIWCKGSPKHGQQSNDDVVAFIDSYITCKLPSDNDPELQNLVSLETHKHSHSCKKKSKKQCRFGFPKPPLDKTMILEPLSSDCLEETKKSVHINNWKKIQEHLKDIHTLDKNLTFKQFLQSLSLSKEQYISALRSSIRTSTVFLTRATTETRINSYNPSCLRAWRANMDLQYVLDVYACAAYIAAYVTKSHRGMSELLRNAASEARKGNLGLKQQVRTIGNKFLNAVEISAQEASYICLGLPMRKSSRKVIFINTSPPSERVSLLKSSSELEKLEDDDENIECANLLTRYASRPSNMENISLANFAANYNQTRKYTVKRTQLSSKLTADSLLPEPHNSDNEDALSDDESNNIQYSKVKKTHIIRYVHFKQDVHEENFYREQLMLFSPWRDENTHLIAGCLSFKERFQLIQSDIIKEKMEYEPYREEVDLAEKSLSTETDMQDVWDELAPVTENLDGISNTTHLSSNPEDNYDLGPDLGIQLTSYEEDLVKFYELPDIEFRQLMRSLNKEQIEFVYDTIHQIKVSEKPIYRFLSGGAGVGKSHVTKALYQMALKYYNSFPGKDFSSTSVLMIAPTGKAAHHIQGSTIHTAMKIPANQKLKHCPLSASTLNTFRSQLSDLKLIFIDEISMVGFNMFNFIHQRLQELKQSKEDFGGVSIIVVGDLFQLKPVMDSYIFIPPNNSYLPLATNLWNSHFLMYELQQIMRQRESKEFALLLNRLREGQQTSSDIDNLKSCSIPQQQNYPHEVQHLFTTNEKVDAHNLSALHHTNHKVYEIKAHDRVVGACSEDLKQKILSSFINATHSSRQLHTIVYLCEGFNYDLTVNLDTADGLTNGASCKLMKIDLAKNFTSGQVWVKFQDPCSGHSLRSTNKQKKNYDASWTPISPVSRQFQAGHKGQAQVQRQQYPLRPAAAKTIHRAQGDTMDKVVVDLTTNRKIDHIHYVALSRVTTKQGLYIINLQDDKIAVNKQVEKEMRRLRDNRLQTCLPFLYNISSTCKIAFLNARSLHRHIEDVRCDYNLLSCHLFACCETRYTLADAHVASSIAGFQNYRQDQPPPQGNTRPSRGIALYVKSPFEDTCHNISHLSIEMVLTEILSIKVVFLYKPPSVSIHALETALRKVHHEHLLGCKSIIMGDFNVDFSKKSTNQQKLQSVTSELCFHQLITKPTTDLNTTIDLIFSNFQVEELHTDVIETFYSDHKIIWIAL